MGRDELVDAAAVALCVAGEDEHRLRVEAAGVSVAEHITARCAEEDREVGLVQQPGRVVATAVAERAGIGGEAFEVVGDGVVRAEVGEDGDRVPCRPAHEFLAALRGPALSAYDDQGPPRALEPAHQLLQLRFCGAGPRHRKRPNPEGGARGEGEYVLGKADHHRAGPAAAGRVDALRDDAGGGGGVVQHDDLLRRAAEPPAEVELLECLPAAVGHRDQPDEEEHRGRVLVRGVDGDEGVGGARPPGHHRHPGQARQPALRQRHEARTALVPGHYRRDRRVVQAVQNVEEGLTGNPVHPPDALALQLRDDQMAGGEGALGGVGGLGCDVRHRGSVPSLEAAVARPVLLSRRPETRGKGPRIAALRCADEQAWARGPGP